MPLPELGTKDWGAEIGFYLQATKSQRATRASVLKMQPHSYEKRMRERGILKNKTSPEIETENLVVNLPPVNIREYKAPRTSKGDGEIAILHASDGHGGKITKSFNKEVYRSRMEAMFQATMTIINLHRNMYPINTLHVFNTGDNGQGENPHQGCKIGEVEMGARDQTKKITAPMWNDILGSFKQHFKEVIFHGVKGNHGSDKYSPETSSEDLRLYDLLEAGIGQEKGITVNVYDDWSQIVNIMGFKCFLFHGDGIMCQQGVPFFALDKKLKAWYMQYGGFQYAFGGHFHKRHSDEISSRLEYFMCSTLVSDDDWALKKLGISSNPSQNLYGLHERYGITWRYAIQVDKAFLPEKVEV